MSEIIISTETHAQRIEADQVLDLSGAYVPEGLYKLEIIGRLTPLAENKAPTQNQALEPNSLFAALREIVGRIEDCGASPKLTDAVSLASDLRRAIGNTNNPACPYAFRRVKSTLTED